MARQVISAWQIGAWVADPTDDSLTRGSESLKLEPRMMRLLLRLAESPGTVITQEQLLTEVWSGVVVGSASVYQSISQLRKVLGDTGPAPIYIETVARKGYRLIAPVSRIAAVDSSPASAAPLVQPTALRSEHIRRRWVLGLTAVAAFAIAAAIWFWTRPTADAGPQSIAVLPFIDMTVEKTGQAFCDGVSEEVSNWLAQIPMLRVVSRTSASAFRNKDTDVREIGRQLGTTLVLEGSLRKSGSTSRVSVQLIDTRDGYNVWSASFDSALSNVLEVQEQVARAVASNLELRMTDQTTERLADRRSNSGRAYSLYLIARHHQQQRTKTDNERAIELYRQAIDADPNFSLAQVGLAYAYLNQRYFNDRPIESIAQDAAPLLAGAARHTPKLADLYVVRGALETELKQKDAAVRDLQRALELNPNSRDAAAELGFYNLVGGDPKLALAFYTQAAALDPLDYYLRAQRCLALTDLGKFDAASAACEGARALDPGAAWALSTSSALEEAQGHISEALKWNAAAIARSADVQELYSDRGRWLMTLNLPERARESYAAAVGGTDHVSANARLVWLDLVTLYAQGGTALVQKRIAATHWDASSDPDVLFELADVELIAGDAGGARVFVDRALASPDLKPDDLASPWQARVGYSYLLIAAAARQATGNVTGANEQLAQLGALLNRLVAAGMSRYGVFVLQAQAAALRGDPDAAMLALQRAAEIGWRDVWLAEHEPYFQQLRGRPDFRALLDRIRAQNGTESKKLDDALQNRAASETPAPNKRPQSLVRWPAAGTAAGFGRILSNIDGH
jgi:TolB-like protein/DNA-binding winged helix-turn-helix (wHTH) protein